MSNHQNHIDQSTVPMSKNMDDMAQTMLRTGMLQAPTLPGAQGSVDRFEIIKTLSTGGMGQVFLAREPITDGKVALKMIRPELAEQSWAIQRFLTEAQHMYRLSHPNILKVLEVSDRKEGPYYVMPYIEGGSLAQRIHTGVPLPDEFILHVALQLAEALKFAHGRGIIHRDLKPANVMMDQSGCVYLTDFGLLRTVFNDATVDAGKDMLEGTAVYMSPLAAAGKAEDTRCDIYAFGAMLYEMLTGQRPYTGDTADEIIQKILAGPPRPILDANPQASKTLALIAEGCMARELRDRYAEMADVARDLERAARGENPLGPHGHPTPGHTFSKMMKPAIGGILGLILAASVIGVTIAFFHKDTHPESAFYLHKLLPENAKQNPKPIQADLPLVIKENAIRLATNPKELLHQFIWIESTDTVYFVRRIYCKNWSRNVITNVTLPWTEGVIKQVYDYNGKALYFERDTHHTSYKVSLNDPIPTNWTFRLVVIAQAADFSITTTNDISTFKCNMVNGSGVFIPSGSRLIARYAIMQTNGRAFYTYGKKMGGATITYADVGNRAFNIYEREARKADSPEAHWDQALAEFGIEDNELLQTPPVYERKKNYDVEYTFQSQEDVEKIRKKRISPQTYSLQFINAPIKQILTFYERTVDQPVLLSQQVDPALKLTMKAGKRVTKPQAKLMIETMLHDAGIQLTETNGFIMAEPVSNAATDVSTP